MPAKSTCSLPHLISWSPSLFRHAQSHEPDRQVCHSQAVLPAWKQVADDTSHDAQAFEGDFRLSVPHHRRFCACLESGLQASHPWIPEPPTRSVTHHHQVCPCLETLQPYTPLVTLSPPSFECDSPPPGSPVPSCSRSGPCLSPSSPAAGPGWSWTAVPVHGSAGWGEVSHGHAE